MPGSHPLSLSRCIDLGHRLHMFGDMGYTISRLRKKGKALSRSVLSLNCLGGIRHVIGQFD